MHSAIQSMLAKYRARTHDEYKNALKEVVQEIALLGLHRSGFFDEAAFYGGTALRIFHGLNRFSEDLDFSLLAPDSNFTLTRHIPALADELGAYGLVMRVEEKEKKTRSNIRSAFIKGGTEQHLLMISPGRPPVEGLSPGDQIKLKIEVDIDPPTGGRTEVRYRLLPIPFSVCIFQPPSLFAGKVHALLCRAWQNRQKGRDYYDYLWYLSHAVPLDLPHLQSRMIQSGHLGMHDILTETDLRERLEERFAQVDIGQIRGDALPFVADPRSLELWSADFFISVTRDRLRVTA